MINNKKTNISRRSFLGSSVALTGGVFLKPLSVGSSAYVAGNDTIKIALIGCGSRGAGAVRDAIQTEGPVELVAMADVFRDQIDSSYENLRRIDRVRDHINVPEEHKFVGLNSYKQAIALADVVLLASPPAFRPEHFEASIRAGKHVFMEKPLASDAPGIRKILATGKLADQQGLKVVVGLQYRYQSQMQELVRRIQQGEIGDITSARCHYLINDIRLLPRLEGQSELEYQLWNWRHFCWLWAGSPAGLTIHLTDIVNWVKETHPVRAFGTGGRSAFKGPERGDVFDNFYVEYEYADGTLMHSTTRHVLGGWLNRGCYFHGTKGTASYYASTRESDIKNRRGDIVWNYEDTDDPSPYQVEHDVFFKAIREDIPHNDTERAAHSTLTEIMARMAVHSGHRIEWEEALNSDVVLVPENLTLDSEAPVMPKEDGHYPIPVPGSKDGIV
ncbi:MAG: Gfo/Idh/MocA family oxidoreductase [Balneolales bacterium]